MTEKNILPDRTSPNHLSHPRDSCDIIFVTVCTKRRIDILANDVSHRILSSLWHDTTHWVVGRYVLMPDHIHLFARHANRGSASMKEWITWWKRKFSLHLKCGSAVWQQSFWDTRMRSESQYHSKWLYVRDNPVRAGLVTSHEEWSFQGEIYVLKA
jgi:putative transposase